MLGQYLFIVGAQKSGTTSLSGILNRHNEIAMAPGEVRFFEDPWFSDDTHSAVRGLFKPPKPAWLGIKRPSYMFKPEVPARIRAFSSTAKIIVILRDPVDRLVSAYFHYMQYRVIPFAPLNAGVKRLIASDYSKRYPMSDEIIAYGFYGSALKRYLEHFDRDDILVLKYDQLKEENAPLLPSVAEFLSIPDAWPEIGKEAHSNKGYRSPQKILAARIGKKIGFVYNRKEGVVYPRDQTWATKKMARLVKRFENSLPSNEVWNTRLDEEIRHTLRDIYREDQKVLFGETGISFFAPVR